jgi:chemotaxis protein CheZ
MSDDLDDLDALFDAVAAEHQAVVGAAPLASAAEAAASQAVVQQPEVDPQPELAVAPELDSPPDSAEQTSLPMYTRLGQIVRELHDALRQLGQDRPLIDAVHEMFDSQERLKYIASLTEQAANKVLNAVDESLPAQEAQAHRAQEIARRWQAMYEGRLSIEEFKQLAADSRDFATAVATGSEAEKARLMDIMMAQDFQDITGQIIKKVVSLTGNLELQLTQLLRDYAPIVVRNAAVDLLSGPNVPTASMMQNDVDSLLGELGF